MKELKQGDCLVVMNEIKDQTVDLILADLPYGTTACKWDSIINLDKLWAHYKRIIKPTGNIVLTAQQPFTWKLCSSNPEWFKYEIIWEKPNATNPFVAKYQPLKSHENILIFNQGGATYNPQMSEGEAYKWNSKRSGGDAASLTSDKNEEINNEGTRYPRSVQKFPQNRGLHPTQKSVELFTWIINTYTNSGDLVLDNCAGSGTTAEACIITERDYIMIEQDEKYFEIIKKRVDNLTQTSISEFFYNE